MRNLLVLVAMLVLCIPGSLAYTAIGHLNLTVINTPPEITDVQLDTAVVYPDSHPSCTAMFWDEDPGTATTQTVWEVNGMTAQEGGTVFTGTANPGDELACHATITDKEGALSATQGILVTVQEPPPTAVRVQQAMGLLGKDLTTQEAADLQQQGLSAVTGFAVSSATTERPGLVGLLLVIAIILGLLVGRSMLSRRERRRRQQSKDLYSSLPWKA